MPFPQDVPICDPHFHVWDVSKTPNPNLGGIVDLVHPVRGESAARLGIYTGASYLFDAVSAAPGPLPLAAALHVETCVGQVDGGHKLDTVEETRFVLENGKLITGSDGKPIPMGVVAFVHLGREDAAATIAAHRAAAGSAFRGVRMILNYSHSDPSLCWPQVGTDVYLKGTHELFNKNFPLLAANDLVFDLHCNWYQLVEAALFLARHGPATTVVIDHLGVVKLGTGDAEEDARRIREWKAGMAALAANPNVNVKISGLEYIKAGWLVAGSPERALLAELVDFVVATFTPARCLVASNWPVDLAMGKSSMPALYEALHEILAKHSHADRVAMFYGNAMRVYGMGKL